jgi:hypothetical protein
MIRLRRAKASATYQQPGQPAEVPIPQLTTSELQRLREDLKYLLALETLPPVTRSREELQQTLADVIAEQEDRERMAREASAKLRAETDTAGA